MRFATALSIRLVASLTCSTAPVTKKEALERLVETFFLQSPNRRVFLFVRRNFHTTLFDDMVESQATFGITIKGFQAVMSKCVTVIKFSYFIQCLALAKIEDKLKRYESFLLG